MEKSVPMLRIFLRRIYGLHAAERGGGKCSPLTLAGGSLTGSCAGIHVLVCMEKTNIRYVTPEDNGEPIAFPSIAPLSSPDKVPEPIRNYLTPDGEIVARIKPQFEAGREKVGKKKASCVRRAPIGEVIEKVAQYAQSYRI